MSGQTEAEATVASDIGFVEYVCEQIRGAGHVSHRRMFGEFAVYCDGKVVAFVCDNQFFLKPTAPARHCSIGSRKRRRTRAPSRTT